MRMWEDTLVEVLGGHWRTTMASCRSDSEWAGVSRRAIEDLIHNWKLPKSALPSRDKIRIRIEEKKTTTAKQFLMVNDISEYIEGRIQFVVDCQTLSDITCGRTPVNSPVYAPIIERFFNNILNIASMGSTFQNVLTPIEWRPRNSNQLADDLANYSMDLETNIEWACDVGGSWRNRDIIAFSDGGLRCKRGKASAAWISLEKPRCNHISACPISACGVVGWLTSWRRVLSSFLSNVALHLWLKPLLWKLPRIWLKQNGWTYSGHGWHTDLF